VKSSRWTLHQKEMALRIVSLRRSKKISLAAFARILSLSRPTTYDLESGNRRLFADELLVISKTLDVSVDWLLGTMPSPLSHLQVEKAFPMTEEICKIVLGTVGQILDVLQVANTERCSSTRQRARVRAGPDAWAPAQPELCNPGAPEIVETISCRRNDAGSPRQRHRRSEAEHPSDLATCAQ
jgi:transcriptional regulator with XRE-family HTH domain